MLFDGTVQVNDVAVYAVIGQATPPTVTEASVDVDERKVPVKVMEAPAVAPATAVTVGVEAVAKVNAQV